MTHKPTLAIIALILIVSASAVLASGEAPDPQGVVNINTADAAQLQLLPRIGPALAERIIAFRDANGPFESSDELVAVRGIGERSIEALKPFLTVSGATTLTNKVRVPRSRSSRDVS